MRTKSNNVGPRPDYLASYPNTGPHMRRLYPGAAKVGVSTDYHSEQQYKRSDRFTAFSNCNGQSIKHGNEIVDLPRGIHCMDETTPFSSRWCFDNGGPSLPRGLPYGDEIPSLSTQRRNGNEALSRSTQWHYGAEIPSLSSRQSFGDEIPSLSTQKCNGMARSSQWHYGAEIPSLSSRQGYADEIPSLSTQKCNGISYSSQWQYGAEIPSLSSRQSYGDEIPSLSRRWRYQDKIPLYSGQRFHDAEAHRLPSYQHGASHGSGHSRDNYMSSLISHQHSKMSASKHTVTRPRVANRIANSTDHCRFSKKENPWRNSEDIRDQVCGPRASKSNDASTPTTKKDITSPLVNTSGQFVGLAEMLGPVDFKKTMDFWQQDKWNGFFPIIWHIIKDIPNLLFKHITLENNDNRPVTFSRDTQEIGLLQGLEVLKIFKAYRHGTSILDDFDFYEEKENTRCARKGINVDSLHEARLSYFGTDDLKSMGNLEASMESMSFYETWD